MFLKNFFKWLIPETIKGGIQYYATKEGMKKGAKKVGKEMEKAGGKIMLGFKRRF